jgi:F-type H+-transporting ATPase subunit b
MEQTFEALGGILLNAIPTIILLIFLHFYLKFVLFKPLQKVLKEREALTAGARKAAEQSLAAAERKAAEYDAKFRDARAEVYKQQEETRKTWLQDQAAQVAEARGRNEGQIKDARFQIAQEAAGARQNLLETSTALADQIATRVLARRAGGAV